MAASGFVAAVEVVVKAIGPSTSIGDPFWECLGLSPEFLLRRRERENGTHVTLSHTFHPPTARSLTYLSSGDRDLGLSKDPDREAECVVFGPVFTYWLID